MAEIQVGKVMLTFKGEYDSTKKYTRLDAVTYQGSSYVCLADTSTTPPSDSWQVLAKKGTDGKDGQPGHDGKDGKDGQTPDVSKLATKTDLTNYYTKAETDSAISSSIDNIQIGGRNLLLNSSKEKSGKSYDFAQYNFAEDLQPGETYTLSAYGRIDQTAVDHKQFIEIYVYDPNWSYYVFLKLPASLTNTYGQLTFTVPADKHPVKYLTVFLTHPDGATDNLKDNLSGTAFVNYLKLEKGNVATDWTPAPEDTITAIQNNATAIGQANQQITDLQMAVSNTVTTITSGTLADLANKVGVYHYEIDFIPSDGPAYNWGMCDVVVGENYAKEVFTDTSTTDVYVRTRKSESWSEWRQITLWN